MLIAAIGSRHGSQEQQQRQAQPEYTFDKQRRYSR